MKPARKIDKFLERIFLSTQLDKIDIAFNHCLRHALGVGNTDVTEIQDSVEAAIA